ncbi:MAG: ROK family transcriptional regulator [bacterium]|nr:ROK family transcriptional regulator [bacterium]MCY4257770.1 ROK family transcriptional regulator [bacterium]
MRGHSDSRLLRLLNGQRILDALFDAAPHGISRADIARVTGLSKPTVSNLTADLEAAGLIRPSAPQTTLGNTELRNVGRPASPYEFVPEAGFVVAVDMGATKTIIGIANLLGTVVAEREVATSSDAEAALGSVTRNAKEMLFEIGAQARSACVGVPGIYHVHSDTVENALNLPGFANLCVRATLEELLGMNVHVDNDVNLAALAEADANPEQANFLAISVGTGIGMGIIIDGELYRGTSGGAGELGSLLLNGTPQQPTAPVILEDVASAPAIRKSVTQATESGYLTSLDGTADVPEILSAAANGDPAAAYALQQSAQAMAYAVAQMHLTIDPERVVFGGGVGSNPVFVDAVKAELHVLHPHKIEVIASTLGRRATFLGAVSLALSELHASLVADTLARTP